MFDIVVAFAPNTPFAPRICFALRGVQMRVVPCEVAPLRPPPAALRVDAAVVCAPTGSGMLDVARSVQAALDGPPPLVGVSGGPPVSRTHELAQALPDDVPEPMLAMHVQRAAAQAERRPSRVILRGDLADVGLDELLAPLAAKGRSCFVRVREGARRAEVTLDAGRLVHVRADGVDAGRDRQAALHAIEAWMGATFEVIATDGARPPRTSSG